MVLYRNFYLVSHKRCCQIRGFKELGIQGICIHLSQYILERMSVRFLQAQVASDFLYVHPVCFHQVIASHRKLRWQEKAETHIVGVGANYKHFDTLCHGQLEFDQNASSFNLLGGLGVQLELPAGDIGLQQCKQSNSQESFHWAKSSS